MPAPDSSDDESKQPKKAPQGGDKLKSPLADMEGDWPPPVQGEVTANKELLDSISEQDWQESIKNSPDLPIHFIATEKDNEEHTKQGYKGTIYNKTNDPDPANRIPLVHISEDGLVCPQVDGEENKKLQAIAIANSLALMASKSTNPGEPLNVMVKGFTKEELEPILQELKNKNTTIKFTVDEQASEEIKTLLKDFNNSPQRQKNSDTQKPEKAADGATLFATAPAKTDSAKKPDKALPAAIAPEPSDGDKKAEKASIAPASPPKSSPQLLEGEYKSKAPKPGN